MNEKKNENHTCSQKIEIEKNMIENENSHQLGIHHNQISHHRGPRP